MAIDIASRMTDALPEEYGISVVKGILGIVFEVLLFFSLFKIRLTISLSRLQKDVERIGRGF